MRGVEPVGEYEIRGGGGITLHAREWGNPDGPEISSTTAGRNPSCTGAQVDGPLEAESEWSTFDNRGHGLSEKLLDPSSYADEQAVGGRSRSGETECWQASSTGQAQRAVRVALMWLVPSGSLPPL